MRSTCRPSRNSLVDQYFLDGLFASDRRERGDLLPGRVRVVCLLCLYIVWHAEPLLVLRGPVNQAMSSKGLGNARRSRLRALRSASLQSVGFPSRPGDDVAHGLRRTPTARCEGLSPVSELKSRLPSPIIDYLLAQETRSRFFVSVERWLWSTSRL